jgi:hypothetical protein
VEDDLSNSNYIVESGRAVGGRMFIRVVHQPTGKSRVAVGLGGLEYQELVDELIVELKREVEES